MQLTVSYQNSAQINTGTVNETMSPQYKIVWDFEIPKAMNKMDVTADMLKKLKSLIDPLLLADMKSWAYARYKCSCKPLFIKGQLIHELSCLYGTAQPAEPKVKETPVKEPSKDF